MKEMSDKEWYEFMVQKTQEISQKRDEFQKRLVKRHKELSDDTIRTQDTKELTKIIKIVNSWLMNFDVLKQNKDLVYIEIENFIPSKSWEDFVQEWKPKYELIKESAKFKLDDLLLSKQTMKKSSPQHQKGFDLGFSDKQLEKLYNELKEHRFIDIETNSKHFINAFNGKDLEEGFKPLKWIDESRNHYITMQTVFQLLDSCNVSFKGENNIIPQVRETIKLIFENDFGNMQSKYNDFNALKTPRHILIDSKVKDLALNLNKI